MFDQLVTFLYTRDLERSAAFYGDMLGLPLVLDQGGCRIFRISRDAFLGICACSEARPRSPDGRAPDKGLEELSYLRDSLDRAG